MGTRIRVVALVLAAASVVAADFSFEQRLDLKVGEKAWLGTVVTPFDEARRQETGKVYTHIFDFEGGAPITKGPGGKYPHHRGLFIGWKDTLVGGRDLDTWHNPDNSQRHVGWKALETSADRAAQVEEIEWVDDATGKPFIRETRTVAAREGDGGIRLFDFTSELTSLAGTIRLKGDLQHAGMHVRLANEVSEHEDTTQYILPEGGQELEGDKVVGAWWVCCSAVVRDKRYWLVHMTAPDNPTGQPVYSIRRYARFGAFFEPELAEGKPLAMKFRVAVSETELTRERCEALYRAFAGGAP